MLQWATHIFTMRSLLFSTPHWRLCSEVNECWLSSPARQKFYSPDISFIREANHLQTDE
jgi:hypothetical protein